jgi:hypothetical protein
VIRFIGVIGVLSASIALASSCKPQPGSSCAKGEARCFDEHNQLACESGEFVQTPCKGPGGCVMQADGSHCDITKNEAGDRCSKDDEGAAMCASAGQMLVCHAGKYLKMDCRGEHGCSTAVGRTVCDSSVAKEGDACRDGMTKACDVDGARVLSCKSGQMRLAYECRGPDGCKVVSEKLECDMSVAAVGDLCGADMAGQHACSAERASIVICKDGHFAVDEPCRNGEKCIDEGETIKCGKLKP